MRNTARQTHENRTIPVDCRSEATSFQLRGDRKAFRACVLAFLMSFGLQLQHQATCRGGGCLTRQAHSVRVRLGGVTIWRRQCTPGPPCAQSSRLASGAIARGALRSLAMPSWRPMAGCAWRGVR